MSQLDLYSVSQGAAIWKKPLRMCEHVLWYFCSGGGRIEYVRMNRKHAHGNETHIPNRPKITSSEHIRCAILPPVACHKTPPEDNWTEVLMKVNVPDLWMPHSAAGCCPFTPRRNKSATLKQAVAAFIAMNTDLWFTPDILLNTSAPFIFSESSFISVRAIESRWCLGRQTREQKRVDVLGDLTWRYGNVLSAAGVMGCTQGLRRGGNAVFLLFKCQCQPGKVRDDTNLLFSLLWTA